MMRVFVSWSGGKDSSLAMFRAMKNGLEIAFLLTMLGKDGSTSASHGLTKEVLDIQARAMGIPIVYGKASRETYEQEFKRILRDQKAPCIDGGVFGDINLQEHKNWLERVCGDLEIKPFLPLWNEDYEILLNELFQNGFEAIIVSAKTDLVDRKWIGRPFDLQFMKYIHARKLDRFGEKGEFHTLVTNGPIFKQPLRIVEFSTTFKDGLWIPEKLKVDLLHNLPRDS